MTLELRLAMAIGGALLVGGCAAEPPEHPERAAISEAVRAAPPAVTSVQLAPTGAPAEVRRAPAVAADVRKVPNHDADITTVDRREAAARMASSASEGAASASLSR